MQQPAIPQQQTSGMNAQQVPSTITTAEIDVKTSELEALLVEIWSKELGIAQIGVNQNIFDLGSKSLTIRTVQAKLQQRLQRSIPITLFFMYPRVNQLAYYLTHES
jgi:hypothetical protein